MARQTIPQPRAFCLALAAWLFTLLPAPGFALSRGETAEKTAAAGELAQLDVQAGDFLVRTWMRVRRPDQDLSVYIEGDGHAWESRTQRSDDPTPVNPLGLRMASWDPAPNVVYLARPCQYVPLHYNPGCNDLLWTDERFSEAVVTIMNQALDTVRSRVAGRLHLAGFSGGGAIAALLAARRRDVDSLRTFAGNLDHVAVNAHHRVSQMPRSLNPIDFADRLGSLPQVHYSGARDTIVPPEIAQRFIDALPTRGCAEHFILDNTTHHSGWHAHRELLWQIPRPTHAWCRPDGARRWRRTPVTESGHGH